MFKTYNVAESLWQMNLFMTLQVYRNLSTLSYAASTEEDEPEREEVTDRDTAALNHQKAA